jgi:Gpi18-like mannosyltransferase
MMLNSSLWGQSDALYALPVVASLYFMLRDRPLLASVLFGVGVSLKLQAIFFLPILIGYLSRTKETRPYIVVPFLVYMVTILPIALVGGDMAYWLLVYAKESGEYPYLSVSAPSMFAFVNGLSLSAGVQNVLFWCGITLAGAWAIVVAYFTAHARNYALPTITLITLACVLVIPYLLPRMHERYFYLADVISCLYVLFVPRRWYLAVLIVGASTLAYMPYLSSQIPFLSGVNIDLRIPAVMLLSAIVIVLVDLFTAQNRALLFGRRVGIAVDPSGAGARAVSASFTV